jgi:hypothetical protein
VADHVPVGVLGIADQLRPDALAAVTRLAVLTGAPPVLPTGDNQGAAAALAASVGIVDVRSSLLPEEKVAAVEELQSDGKHLAPAAVALRVSAFALALLLTGAEPEELATGVAASVRHAPGVAFGDVIGANVAMCLVALGVGAVIAPLPFGTRVRRYGLLALPAGGACALVAWGGKVSQLEGGLLVAAYIADVGVNWTLEGQPPAIGETAELDEARHNAAVAATKRRVRGDLLLILAGVAAMSVGATVLVEGVRHLAHADNSQIRLGLTLIGFVTAFELHVPPPLLGLPPRSSGPSCSPGCHTGWSPTLLADASRVSGMGRYRTARRSMRAPQWWSINSSGRCYRDQIQVSLKPSPVLLRAPVLMYVLPPIL